jgi:hypothetical protein
MCGLGVTTIHKIVIEVCEVVVTYLWQDYVSSYFPLMEEDMKEKMIDMEEIWQFPCCWGLWWMGAIFQLNALMEVLKL